MIPYRTPQFHTGTFLTFDQIKQRFLPALPKVPPENEKHKKEYLFLRGINIECFRFNEFYCKYEKDTPNVFDTPQCRRLESFLKKFLLAQEFGYLGDLSEVHFKFSHLSWVVNIKELMADFIENIEIENEDLQESIKRFNSVFDKFYKKLNINKETYEEFYKGLDDYAYIQGFANLNLRNLYNTGYSSNDVVGIYATIQREEDRYEIYSDSDSDSDIYILPSSDSDSDSEFETD